MYGVAGTLNMADLAARVPQLGGGDRVLLEIGAAVLGIAFLVKAGMWPLGFWLPATYSAASAPAARTLLHPEQGRRLRRGAHLAASSSAARPASEFLAWGGMATLVFGMVGPARLAGPGAPRELQPARLLGHLLAAVGARRPGGHRRRDLLPRRVHARRRRVLPARRARRARPRPRREPPRGHRGRLRPRRRRARRGRGSGRRDPRHDGRARAGLRLHRARRRRAAAAARLRRQVRAPRGAAGGRPGARRGVGCSSRCSSSPGSPPWSRSAAPACASSGRRGAQRSARAA